MRYEYTKLRLQKREFDKLVFMNAPPHWEKDPDTHSFLLSLCKTTLNEVVEKMIATSGCERHIATPTQVFESLDVIAADECRPWFQKNLIMSYTILTP